MSIRLDRIDVIQASASFRQFQNIFLVGSILMIGLYHLSMFLLGEKYRSSLYFGIFCCLIALRSMVMKNDGIPLSARIVAVADVYDALTSKRSYKKAFSHTEAVRIITEGRAKHFDPDVVDQFERLS